MCIHKTHNSRAPLRDVRAKRAECDSRQNANCHHKERGKQSWKNTERAVDIFQKSLTTKFTMQYDHNHPFGKIQSAARNHRIRMEYITVASIVYFRIRLFTL